MANGPVHLIEDADTGDRFLVYDGERGVRLDIRYEGETLWMTQEQIARLFGRDRTVVTKHIANVIDEGELDEASGVQKMHTTTGRPPLLYSLDMVISVGYRVSSAQATLFRRWATGILVQFAKAGFVVDSARLKDAANADRIAELREIVRDIRSDEANVYRELKRICALCQDYDPKSDRALTFFQQTQAKLVYAVMSKTPSELLVERADHRQPDMGLTSWPNDNIRKQDVTVSKNYLAEAEIRELNRLTTILLDIFEDQADLGRASSWTMRFAFWKRSFRRWGAVSCAAAARSTDGQRWRMPRASMPGSMPPADRPREVKQTRRSPGLPTRRSACPRAVGRGG